MLADSESSHYMEEASRKNRRFLRRAISLPNLTEDHFRDDPLDLRLQPALLLSADARINAASPDNTFRLQKSTDTSRQHAEILSHDVNVSESQRKGFLAGASFLAEVQDPYQYPHKTKWIIVFLVAYASAAAPMGSAIFFRPFRVIHAHVTGSS